MRNPPSCPSLVRKGDSGGSSKCYGGGRISRVLSSGLRSLQEGRMAMNGPRGETHIHPPVAQGFFWDIIFLLLPSIFGNPESNDRTGETQTAWDSVLNSYGTFVLSWFWAAFKTRERHVVHRGPTLWNLSWAALWVTILPRISTVLYTVEILLTIRISVFRVPLCNSGLSLWCKGPLWE